jgi:hypothetical protein
MTENVPVQDKAADARMLAGAALDYVRERLATYTSVDNGHKANILAYTGKMLGAVLRANAAGNLGLSTAAVEAKYAEELRKARAAGFWVDESV